MGRAWFTEHEHISHEFEDLNIIEPCYCNRDITVTELKKIVKELREKEVVVEAQGQSHKNGNKLYSNANGDEFFELKDRKKKKGFYKLIDKEKGTYSSKEYEGKEEIKRVVKRITKFSDLGTNIFQSKRSEKIKSSEANNYSLFAEYLNKTFNKYDIKTCIRKIHFLAQSYHESTRFVNTYEALNKGKRTENYIL